MCDRVITPETAFFSQVSNHIVFIRQATGILNSQLALDTNTLLELMYPFIIKFSVLMSAYILVSGTVTLIKTAGGVYRYEWMKFAVAFVSICAAAGAAFLSTLFIPSIKFIVCDSISYITSVTDENTDFDIECEL